jgi:hypothetical protein
VEKINSNRNSPFKVKPIDSNTTDHDPNGPNAYPIKFLQAKKKQEAMSVIWESDCCDCRVESANNLGTSSGNLLFANFHPTGESPEIFVQSKRAANNRGKNNSKLLRNEDEEGNEEEGGQSDDLTQKKVDNTTGKSITPLEDNNNCSSR